MKVVLSALRFTFAQLIKFKIKKSSQYGKDDKF
jgi:hypothetical protein